MLDFPISFRKPFPPIIWLVIFLLFAGFAIPLAAAGDESQEETSAENSIPKDLVGSWYAGSGYTSAPYNPSTNTWGTPTGKGLIYVFNQDGSYTKAFQSYVSNNGCTTGFTAFESGKVVVKDKTLVTTPDKGRMVYRDNCSPSLNSDKPTEDLKKEEFMWEFKPNEADPSVMSLQLTRSDGAGSAFRRL